MKTIAIIPARGGSKRIPRKNIKDFFGKPMVAWSILAAKNLGKFDKIIVSTDDHEIAEIAKEWGAEIPFMRPAELATDMTMTAPVIEHALKFYLEQGISFKHCCCIYPTAPFIEVKDLLGGFDVVVKTQAPVVYSITEFPYPIYRAVRRNDDGSVEMLWPENENVRSQDLPEAYHDAGQWYWFTVHNFLQDPRLIPKGAVGYILPRTRVQDIDTPEDFEVAQLMASTLLK